MACAFFNSHICPFLLNAELWNAGRWAGTDVASPGTEKEEAGFPHATAGVHYLEFAEGRQRGGMSVNALLWVFLLGTWCSVQNFGKVLESVAFLCDCKNIDSLT